MGLGLSYVLLLEFHGKPHNFTNVIFMTSSFSNSITQLNSDRFYKNDFENLGEQITYYLKMFQNWRHNIL